MRRVRGVVEEVGMEIEGSSERISEARGAAAIVVVGWED